MATYLLTWNPEKYSWDDLESNIHEVEERGVYPGNWSCGHTKKILPGDRLFLLRQGKEPRGIVGSGWATSESYEAEHWNPEMAGKNAVYVEIQFTILLNAEKETILPRIALNSGLLAKMNWNTLTSGITIPEEIAAQLEIEWQQFLVQQGKIEGIGLSADEVSDSQEFFEGATRTVSVNVYERDPVARKLCIQHHGVSCLVCGFDFQQRYGELGAGFIHVHHLIPLSEVGAEYQVQPINDLRPVCPNCHAMLHRRKPPITIEELRAIWEAESGAK